MTTPPPTPKSPLNSPAAVPIAASLSVRRCWHARHTRGHVRRRHARRGARARALRSGPLGHPARHRRHARADRPPRRRRRRARADARCSSSPSPSATGSSAASAAGARRPRARWSRSARSPTSETTAPSCCPRAAPRSRSTPRSPPTSPRCASSPTRVYTPELQRLRVRSEDKLAIKAFHWRGAPDEDAAEEAVRAIADEAQAAGPEHPLGAQGARGPPAGDDQQGPRRAPAARGARPRGAACTSATT